MSIRVILLLIFGCPLAGMAQYFQYSQYNFTDARVNPAMAASSDYASAGFIFRNQDTRASDIALKSSMISVAYPFLNARNGKRWSGLGLTLMDDRSGSIFTVQEASFSYAINVFLSRLRFLSLGFKGLYQQRSVNMNGLYTGAQYLDDRGFDPSLFNGENFGVLRSNFATFSSGLYWQQNDREGRRQAWWGISFFDLNRPQDSFSGIDNELHTTLVASGGIRLDEEELAFIPQVLFTRSSSKNVLNVGVTTSYELRPYPNWIAGRVDVITNYVPGRSAIFGLQFHCETFSVGFSYDLPIGRNNPANAGAFEVGLQIRRLVDPSTRTKATQKKKSPPPRKQTQKVKKAIVRPPSKTRQAAGADSLTHPPASRGDLRTVLRAKSDSVIANADVGRISHEPFVVEKLTLRFNFEFNSSELDASSMEYLDDLSMALKENPHMKVKLTGHTDNIGSASFNMRLSLYRANVVREFLVDRGVEPARVEVEGKGLAEPLNENRTEQDRALNRRVELIIYYQD